MTTQEFSDAFDTLLSSYSHTAEFGEQNSQIDIVLDEYEKSVFLTQAQLEIVKELYSGQYTGESFESTEKLRRELDVLVDLYDYTIEDKDELSSVLTDNYIHTIFTLPWNCLYVIYEQFSGEFNNTCKNNFVLDVIPVTHDEYQRVRKNPFRGPNDRKVLRLDSGNSRVEIVSTVPVSKYTIRFIKTPEPIVLDTLPNVSINEVNTPLTCKLNESLHQDILLRAVRLAVASKMLTNRSNGKD